MFHFDRYVLVAFTETVQAHTSIFYSIYMLTIDGKTFNIIVSEDSSIIKEDALHILPPSCPLVLQT